MADIVKEVAVKFTARADQMVNETLKAANSLNKMQSQLSTLGRFMAGGALTAGFASIGRAIGDNVEYMGQIEDGARRLGMTAKQYQEIGLAAEYTGSGIDTASKAIDKLRKAIGDSILSGKESEGLKRMGLTVRDFQGLNAFESFQKVSKATQNLGSVSLETSALMSLLGKGGAENALILRDLSSELAKAGLYTKEMISDEDLAKMGEMSDRLLGLSTQWKNLTARNILGWVDAVTGETDAVKFNKFRNGLGDAVTDKYSLKELRDLYDYMNDAQNRARAGAEEKAKADSIAAENLARVAGMADRIRDAIQTPAEKMAEKIAEAKEALETLDPSTGKSVLSQTEYDTYAKQLQDAFDKSDPATIERNRLMEEERKAQEDYMKSRAEMGQRYTESNMTPNEKYVQEIAQLNALLNEGAISWDTYGRAVASAKSQLDGATGAAARYSEMEAYMQAGFESTRTPYERYQSEMQKLNEAAAMGFGNPDLWNRMAWQAESALMDAMSGAMGQMPQMMGDVMPGYDMGMMAPPIGAYTQVYPMQGGAPSTPGTAGMATASQILGVLTSGGVMDTAKQQLAETKRHTYLLERLAFREGGIIL